MARLWQREVSSILARSDALPALSISRSLPSIYLRRRERKSKPVYFRIMTLNETTNLTWDWCSARTKLQSSDSEARNIVFYNVHYFCHSRLRCTNSVSSVCVSVCMLELWKALTHKVYFWLAGTIRSSSYVKVIRSRSRLQKQKALFVWAVCGWSVFDREKIVFRVYSA